MRRIATPPSELLNHLIACRHCDLLQQRQPLRRGEWAQCSRCGAALYQRGDRHHHALPILLAALLFWLIALQLPFLALAGRAGMESEMDLFATVGVLWDQGYLLLALGVALTLLLLPLLRVVGLIYVLTAQRYRFRLPYWKPIWHLTEAVIPWTMHEIYLLGALVAMVKLTTIGDLAVGGAMWAFAAFIGLEVWAESLLNHEVLWRRS